MKIIFCLFFIFIFHNSYSEEQKIYLAGGCFWCLEEAFQDEKGIISAISGYSGGHTINPTYKEVSRGDTGHIEALEVIYEDKIISINQIFNIFFQNIDPFDGNGQFCDRGYHYQSAIFISNEKIKNLSNKYISIIENLYNQKVKTLLLDFDKFYNAEDYHQDYYIKNPIRYNYYKKGCGRTKRLEQISLQING
ncbi:MAG: peptide-methionine (S)-S-oxide reductase MsrA [Alphaproteobacteria bacterium]|jgi:peptide-methionine (S)-S-oxide reductase|tara:strand:+ start:2367 stop:2945 length:579 start_codon:yes stop_codon:yes gene_type:complete